MNDDIQKTGAKLPAVDFKKCRKCNKCIEACPAGAILESTSNCCAKCIKYCMTMDVPCSPELFIFNYDACDACGVCITACPHDAVYWFDSGGH